MNIFCLDQDPHLAARMHCDKHVVKMILEYGQMLSTAHRMRDGRYTEWKLVNPETGKCKRLAEYLLPFEVTATPVWRPPQNIGDLVMYVPGKFTLVIENQQCYRTAHANHPCSMWVRETDANYHWLAQLFEALLKEYTRRYGKTHSAEKLVPFLRKAPFNIPRGQLTPFPQTMPDEYKHEDVVEAYRRFYVGAKARFARWTNTPVPKWFINSLEGQNVSIFQRTSTVD